MTLKEITEKVAASPNKEWLQKYELKMNYRHLKHLETIKGVINIYSFFDEQIEGYTTLGNLPQELLNIKKRFENAKKNLLALLKIENISKQTWDDNFKDIAGHYSDRITILFNSPEIAFLLKTHLDKPESFIGAFQYLIGDISKVTDKKYFEGYILAYEFTSKDFSAIAERKDAEEKSISSTKAVFRKDLGEAQNQVAEYIANSDAKYEEYTKKMVSLILEQEEKFKEWFGITQKDFGNFNTASKNSIKENEKLYEEKLKLEAPAQYWKKRSRKLRREGLWWLSGLVAVISISLTILLYILSEVSKGSFTEVFEKTGTAIKWSILVITVISLLAYGMRIFAKLTFSSFHLSRDAEEKEQLTYVYLALQKGREIDATERHLIMQSLFSRADSGLLKDDASPTMPGNIMDQMTKR